jgi:hypothetical protein
VVVGRPVRVRPRCCAPSTAWSRTSAAGRWRGTVTGRRPDHQGQPPKRPGRRGRLRGAEPAGHFVTETVEDELAYTMENLGVPPDAMRRRVEDTIDLLGLQELRRSLPAGPLGRAAAAGGHRRRADRVTRILVLDEPTSALDPAAAEEVLSARWPVWCTTGPDRGYGRTPSGAGVALRRPRDPAPGGRRRSLRAARSKS